jgi:uncharacterized membrane protein YoaK (UPF0700 family)
VAGVAAGTLIGRYRTDRTPAKSPAAPAGEHWPAHMTPTLAAELTLLTGVLVGWEVTGSRPAGWAQYVILAVAACAMGIQSAAVVQLGLGNVSTTYLTGTLTVLGPAGRRNRSAGGARECWPACWSARRWPAS